MSEFANNLKVKRKGLFLTQKKAAAMIGVKLPRYQAWEEGRAEPSYELQAKICEVLKIDDLYLFIKIKQVV